MVGQIVEGVDERTLLAELDVVELSSRVEGAYAGRLFSLLGARVRRFGPAVDLIAEAEAVPVLELWLHEGKDVHDPALPLPPAAEVAAGCRLLVVDDGSTDPAFRAWADEVVAAAESLEERPVVVRALTTAQDGPPLPGNSLTTSAWAGMSWAMGDADKVPLSLPFDLASYQTAAHACAAGLAALVAEPTTPQLRSVEVSGRDVLAYFVGMITANFLPYERPWTRDGARPPGSAGVYPASIFPCRDGHVVFMCRSQREWDVLLAAMGSPEWSKDPRFADPRVVARLHADEADSHLVPWIAAQTTDELMAFGAENGLPIAPIRSIAEAMDEPQFAHRAFFGEIKDAAGALRTPTRPWRLTTTPGTATSPRSWPVTSGHSPSSMLTGLRVLDLSWVWSGPLTTSILADMGAEVLKVEHSGHMDSGRMRGRARRGGVEVEGPEHEATPYFNQMNHGKKSVTLDLKLPEAQEIILDLVEHCDVVVENMRPGALDRLGIGYSRLAERNPGVVMLSMSMAGQSGPLKTMKGYAGIMAAMSGLESLIGYDEDNIVGSLSPALGDPNAAGHAITVMLAALLRRRATGRGVHIDLSQIEALLAVLPAPIVQSQLPVGITVPANTHPRFAPYGHFPCAGVDQWVALAVENDEQWSRLAELTEIPVLRDPRWASSAARHAHREELAAALSTWTAGTKRDELVAGLLEIGVPAAPVASFEDVLTSDWARDRALTVDVEHPFLGNTQVFTVPWKFGGQTAAAARPAPLLGSATARSLRELLGTSDEAIATLTEAGVLR